ncbi:MAG: FAD-dependent oxidoreductase [Clostridiales bacterium]|nr:FAD-dependent oxidoreductase [Clostridiales bacterium]
MRNYDIVVIGGGPAGLAAAKSAYENGCRSILLIERDTKLGGILNQCIHNGFGLSHFGEELTGPEYAHRAIEELKRDAPGVEILLDTFVADFKTEKDVYNLELDKFEKKRINTIYAMNNKDGYFEITAKAVILAMGCREKARGALAIPGTRPAGVMTAGLAQHYVNIDGYMVGRKVVILGSGDIGLIMARRMVLEGAEVLACIEIAPQPGGLARNITQCLQDYGIPLYLRQTVTAIHGKDRLTGITVSEVDDKYTPIPGTEREIECDTLLLSCGLIPENELSRKAGISINPKTGGPFSSSSLETSASGVFACGNVLHVHDLADNVTKESIAAGKAAALFAAGQAESTSQEAIDNPTVFPGKVVKPIDPAAAEALARSGSSDTGDSHPTSGSGAVSATADADKAVRRMTCIICPRGCDLCVTLGENPVVSGNSCPRGEEYAINEITHPMRTLTTTIRVRKEDGTIGRISVKSKSEIPKESIRKCADTIHHTILTAPVSVGEEVIPGIVATSAIDK